jgi:anti-anti-sigma regulatory factor
MLTGELRGPERRAERPSLIITEAGGETTVRVEGPVDAGTAAQLRHDLLRRSRGGTVPMAVDLAGVTQLASAGVSALHHVAERHAEQRAPLTLHAPAGCAAQHVLALVGLPYTTAELPGGQQ